MPLTTLRESTQRAFDEESGIGDTLFRRRRRLRDALAEVCGAGVSLPDSTKRLRNEAAAVPAKTWAAFLPGLAGTKATL